MCIFMGLKLASHMVDVSDYITVVPGSNPLRVSWVHQFLAQHWGICSPGFVVGFGLWIFQWQHSGWHSLLCFDLVWVVSISESGSAWASIMMGDYRGRAGVFCFVVGRTSVLLFGTPDISTLCKIL